MIRCLTTLLCALTLGAASLSSLAAGDLSQQPPVEIRVQLGDPDNGLRFVPDRIELETGRLYKLVLHNASPQKHYFSSDGLAGAVYTRKVQVLDQAGATLAEIKGAPSARSRSIRASRPSGGWSQSRQAPSQTSSAPFLVMPTTA